MASEVAKQMHFVLVHGSGHGAWCWYKLKPLLESAGQKVTAIDLSASGINTKSPDEIHTLGDCAEPLMKLMASILTEEKVILVGHSFGGYSLALAMENYAEKIAVAVFLAAFMPDLNHHPWYFMVKLQEQSEFAKLDSQFIAYGNEEKRGIKLILGPRDLSTSFYQLCPTEDLELAKLLVRPAPMPTQDLSSRKFSAEKYGSVKRVYVICPEDKAVPSDFQHWQIENFMVNEVKVIEGADHMAMLSKPEELCRSLLDIACNYYV